MKSKKRLIAYDAVYQYAFKGVHGGGLEDEDFDAIINAIDSVPTVDAVEVVRCKDCKRWVPTGKMAGNREDDLQPIGCCELAYYCRKADNFCSYGERREGE